MRKRIASEELFAIFFTYLLFLKIATKNLVLAVNCWNPPLTSPAVNLNLPPPHLTAMAALRDTEEFREGGGRTVIRNNFQNHTRSHLGPKCRSSI